MRDGGSLLGSERGMPCCPFQIPGCGIGVASRRAGLSHRDLAAGPVSCHFNNSTRPIITRPRTLEKMQHMFCTIGCPQGKQVVLTGRG